MKDLHELAWFKRKVHWELKSQLKRNRSDQLSAKWMIFTKVVVDFLLWKFLFVKSLPIGKKFEVFKMKPRMVKKQIQFVEMESCMIESDTQLVEI